MRRADFHYHLPAGLIAQVPLPQRAASRLLCLDGASGAVMDEQFARLPLLLKAGDLLVFNDTRVIPARLYGTKPTGGRVEMLVERLVSERVALAHLRASKSPAAGTAIRLDGGPEIRVVQRHDTLYELAFPEPVLTILDAIGHLPLPPYIDRPDDAADAQRYQTVYARHPGAVAAPTAGLHFDEGLLAQLREGGVDMTYITLHVGAGTFQPVRAERIEDHRMHAERVMVSEEVCERVRVARAGGGRVVAVGTTAVRSLETAAQGGKLAPYSGETRLFVYPGYKFRAVDALITNFHLPESTLLMLVCAFGGHQHVMNAYRHAVDHGYRFFSYGDAMFVTPHPEARQHEV